MTETSAVEYAASSNSRASCDDDLSIEECERRVLSPPPVPMNLDEASAAIRAASRRSNSSRTHSIGSLHLHAGGDNSSQPSIDPGVSKSKMKPIPNQSRDGATSRSPRGWRGLLCCGYTGPTKSVKPPQPSSLPTDRLNDQVNNGDTTSPTHIYNTPSTPGPQRSKSKLKFWRSNKPSDPDTKLNHTTIPADKQAIDSSLNPSLPSHPLPALPNTVLHALSNDNHQGPLPGSTGYHYPYSPSPKTPHVTSKTTPPQSSSKPISSAPSPIPSLPPVARPGATFPNSTIPRMPTSTLRPLVPSSHQLPGSVDRNSAPAAAGTHVLTPLQWDKRDVTDHSSVPEEHLSYDVSQNGGQGDSSSETLELLTPGMDLLGEPVLSCVNKKCLVIDLDETLVHSWFKYVDHASFIVPVDLEGVKHQIYVCKRPYLDQFLREICPLFECVMFTASLRKYADPVCDFIDSSTQYFHHRLFRESCVFHQNNLIKDLTRLGRDVDQICILDNSPVSFLFQPSNALQIVSWFDDPNDTALLELIPYLKGLAHATTAVDYLRNYKPPPTAAVAQPEMPSWLLMLCNPSISMESDDTNGALDHDGSPLDDEAGSTTYDDYLSEEDAVLSPQFHPPHPYPYRHSQTYRSMLPSQQLQSTGTVGSGPRSQLPSAYYSPSSTNFIHQASRPSSNDSQHYTGMHTMATVESKHSPPG